MTKNKTTKNNNKKLIKINKEKHLAKCAHTHTHTHYRCLRVQDKFVEVI